MAGQLMQAQPAAPWRLHHLDAMRSVLMLLGIVLHAANPYRPDSTWLIVDTASAPGMTWLVEAVHLFRIPGFFVVAGFFAMLSLSRRATTDFLNERLTRLLVPCVATLLVLNVPQTLYLAYLDGSDDTSMRALQEAWVDGRLIGHLWFLVDLAFYLLVVGALANWIRTRLASARLPGGSPQGTVLAMMAAGICWAVAVATMDYVGPAWLHQQAAGLLNPVEWLDYAPYFVAGLLLFGRPGLLEAFSTIRWIDAVAICVTIPLVLMLHDADGLLAAAGIAARTLLVWLLVRCCFALFQWAASQPSPLFRYLSDSSYTVYLFHHVVVILVAAGLRSVGLPVVAKFLIVLVIASAISLGVYHWLVRPSRILTFLFNGKRPPVRLGS